MQPLVHLGIRCRGKIHQATACIAAVKAAKRLGLDAPRGLDAREQLLEPAALVDPFVGVRPDAELLDIIEVDRGRSAWRAFDRLDHICGRRERDHVAQVLRDGKDIEAFAALLGRIVAIQRSGDAGAAQMRIVDRHETQPAVVQGGDDRGFPYALRQPRAARPHAEEIAEAQRQRAQLGAPVTIGYRRQHRLGVAAADHLELARAHHARDARDVIRELDIEIAEQPAADVQADDDAGMALQRLEKRAVAARQRIVDDVIEIADRLVRVHAPEQADGLAHLTSGSVARRITPS